MSVTGCATTAPTTEPTPATVIEGGNPQVTIEMEDGGKIVLEMYPDKAPNHVNNFLALASAGFYDGVIFHRVISNFMIQGGDPDGNGTGGPGYLIKGEMYNNGNKANDLSHKRGTLSMARRGDSYDTAGSQFFIVVEDSAFLDKEYTIFGAVIEGMETVDAIRETKVGPGDRPVKEQKIKKMTVETFGKTYPAPETIK